MLSRLLSTSTVRSENLLDNHTRRQRRGAGGPQLALAALLMSFLASGCAEKSCTEIGCVNGLRVELTASSSWKPGMYKFAVNIDGDLTTCEGTLPLRPCADGPSVKCTPAGNRVLITESGCALPPAQQGFSELRISDESAKSVMITVSRDGTELIKKTITPAYKTSQPNGPDCPGLCTGASDTLKISDGAP